MSTLGEKNDISKEELMAGFAQAGNQKAISANNVPASVLTAPQTQEVAIPQANVPQVDANAAIMGAEQVTGTLQQQDMQRKERDVQQTGQTFSESERKLREGHGILATESAERTKMEESSGLNEARKQLNQLSNQLFNQTANLRQFDVNFTNAMETERLAMGQRGGTKAQFGNFNAEANLQMAVQRSAMVGELYATQSSVQLMQGNIQLAADAVEKALNSFYEPKRQEMQMEMMFFQRNAQLFDKAQDRLAQARMQEIQREQYEMDRAEDMVYSAVQNGYATPEEVQEMMSAETPREQRGLAQMITNRGAAERRNLEKQQVELGMRHTEMQMQKMQMDMAVSAATLNAKNAPDPMQAMLMSLFDDESVTPNVASFEDFLSMRLEGMQGPITQEQMSQYEKEYQESVANYNPQDNKMQRLAFLVATGAINPTQADYIKENLQITAPKDLKRQQEAAQVASTVVRDLNRMLPMMDKAGANAQTLLDQIEGRKGKESLLPILGEMQRQKTRSMAKDAQDLYDLRAMIDSVQSNVSLETLQKLRENSPTGGALGNVSEKQSALLASVLGNLELSQSPQILRQTVQDLGNIMLDTIHGSPEEIQSAFRSGIINYTQAQTMIASRYNASPEMLQLAGMSGANGTVRVQIAPNGDLVPIK
jgi:hypothetical protein